MIPVPGRVAAKLVVALGCALLLFLLVHDRNRWKAKTAHYAQLLAGERAAHGATQASYRAAAERARRADAENLSRVKSQQAQINQRSANDYESRIAAARAAAQRLRLNTAAVPADPGTGRAAPVPGIPAAPGRAAQTAGKDGFPDPDRLIATEQAIQLDELIQWVRRQSEVPVDARRD